MVDVLAIRMSKYQSNTDSALQIISDIVEYEVTRYHLILAIILDIIMNLTL